VVAQKNNRVLVVLGTGGTIAGRASRQGDNVNYVAGQVTAQDLMAGVPALSGCALEVEQIEQIDSKDMHWGVWKKLIARVAHHLARDDVGGVVITHGTDTLEETAFVLQRVLQPNKAVVLTCAMRPATALVPDGPQNLLDAVTVAGCTEVSGVVVVVAGQVHRSDHVTKVHSYRVDAFDSGDAGPVACVEEGVVRWYHMPKAAPEGVQDKGLLNKVLAADTLPRVEIVTSHADADGVLVRSLLIAGERDPSFMPRGLVVAATGNGTVHRALASALSDAQSLGVRVVRASRCARGVVIPGTASPFPDSGGLSPVKARVALALLLLAQNEGIETA
jgi:L-asparaginase